MWQIVPKVDSFCLLIKIGKVLSDPVLWYISFTYLTAVLSVFSFILQSSKSHFLCSHIVSK